MVNADLIRERQSSTINLEQLKEFLGVRYLVSKNQYNTFKKLREGIVAKTRPIFYENFDNLERKEKYELVLKKTLEIIEYAEENKVDNYMVATYLFGSILGTEKQVFGLHFSMFSISINLWSTPEQKSYWQDFVKKNGVFGTYIQTEIGHGTYLRGLETTATYDKNTQEFVLHSPTLTSIKFWPGAAAKSCAVGIVMAKLVIDDKDYGIHAFVVQLRSLDDHKSLPGVELGDIGKKYSYEAIDNGYVKFNKMRIPRFNMLAQFASVSPDGKFERKGNEIVMYACMLIMRGTLCLFGSLLLSVSTTIAIRYSCVRRQTANMEGKEPQIIDYVTQQYRLLPGLATTYSILFSTLYLRDIITKFEIESNMFKNINNSDLAKLHAISAGMKAIGFSECLKFSQLNRLCCGGHGYSASSGLTQIMQEADAGSTYEGDNIVLLLQTARYLLKCGQKDTSPHLELKNLDEIKSTELFKIFEKYIDIYTRLYESSIQEASDSMIGFMTEQNLSEFEAWNKSSVLLTDTAKRYIYLFILYSNLWTINLLNADKNTANLEALSDLFELYLAYGIIDTNAAAILRYQVLSSEDLNNYHSRFYDLLKKVRINALALVDAFDWSDANLCSTLGVYDGNVYEKLFEFARNSKFNESDVNEGYYKYLRPYILKQKLKAKL